MVNVNNNMITCNSEIILFFLQMRELDHGEGYRGMEMGEKCTAY